MCGIVGMIVGSLVYYAIFGTAGNVAHNPDYGWDNTTKGIDWVVTCLAGRGRRGRGDGSGAGDSPCSSWGLRSTRSC